MVATASTAARAALASSLFVAAPLATALALHFGFDPVEHAAAQPLIHRDDGFTGAAACAACHPDQTDSWRRTFHSTMTQRASAETVVGAFDGRLVRWAGEVARPFAKDGRFYMDLPGPQGRRTTEVALTVGSRRYQQYFEREERGEGFAFVRLPILWHIGAQRWMHLNTVFLGPDDPNWDTHRSEWNQNCIFCHNTGPEPRLQNHGDVSRFEEQRFDSRVADLGIACESCHGPGAEHAELERDPRTRYAAHFAEKKDAHIVQPERLDKERSVAVCGQCHGQRMPSPLSRAAVWLTSGPTYRSGDLLLDHVSPVEIDTPVLGAADPDLFRLRFWADGTARLTAYEYQGIAASPCYQRGELTCLSCHTMHGGDVHGQLEPRMRTNDACTQCHEEIGRDVAAHTHHRADSSGSACLDCHMPRIVYGIVDLHRSHRIENPDPAHDAEAGRPNACTLCHLDKSATWAAQETARLWKLPERVPASRPDGAPIEMADALASLYSGDAVQRAVFARAMGRPEAALAPRDKIALRTALTTTLGDAYPSIRWLARKSLIALEEELPLGLGAELAAFDPASDEPTRRAAAIAIFERTAALAPARLAPPAAGSLVRADFRPDLPAIVEALNRQARRVISIGE
jgi:predicted CXXCH cytochrome family protein